MAAKFEIRDEAGTSRFRLNAANDEIITDYEAYGSQPAARNGIMSVQNNAPGAAVVGLTE